MVAEGLGGLIVGFLVKFLLGWLSDKRADKTLREAGRLESERDQALAGVQKQQDIANVAGRVESDDDVMDRLNKGSG